VDRRTVVVRTRCAPANDLQINATKGQAVMGLLLLLVVLFVVLPLATALGLTADSRVAGPWYPTLPDRET
jgi:hypothetical protein